MSKITLMYGVDINDPQCCKESPPCDEIRVRSDSIECVDDDGGLLLILTGKDLREWSVCGIEEVPDDARP